MHEIFEQKESPDPVSKLPEKIDHLQVLTENFDGSIDKLKDELFYQFAREALIEDFFDQLSEYLDPEQVDEFESVLAEVSEKEFSSAISLPYELRERWFEKFYEAIASGKSPKEVAREFVSKTAKYEYDIGFHTSPHDIKPQGDTNQWTIKGTDVDHRDGDRPMAYYSKQYRHLYKKDGSKYVYIVRTSPEDKTDGNWYRNDSLSVVMRMPLLDVIRFVELAARNSEAPDQ